MRKDHRPYFVKHLYHRMTVAYVNHFIRPQLDSLGWGFTFMKPWYVKIFGAPIRIGRFATLVAASDSRIRLCVWPDQPGRGVIVIGDYCMLCPGVRIGAAQAVILKDNCMLAGNVYVTDSDWHGIYNRISVGKTAPVTINSNVWIGDSAIVCKGVTIGENTIIGAGAVVVDDIPANCIAAGNPAKVTRRLDPAQRMVTRAQFFADPVTLFAGFDAFDRRWLAQNTFRHWVRHLLFPSRSD